MHQIHLHLSLCQRGRHRRGKREHGSGVNITGLVFGKWVMQVPMPSTSMMTSYVFRTCTTIVQSKATGQRKTRQFVARVFVLWSFWGCSTRPPSVTRLSSCCTQKLKNCHSSRPSSSTEGLKPTVVKRTRSRCAGSEVAVCDTNPGSAHAFEVGQSSLR